MGVPSSDSRLGLLSTHRTWSLVSPRNSDSFSGGARFGPRRHRSALRYSRVFGVPSSEVIFEQNRVSFESLLSSRLVRSRPAKCAIFRCSTLAGIPLSEVRGFQLISSSRSAVSSDNPSRVVILTGCASCLLSNVALVTLPSVIVTVLSTDSKVRSFPAANLVSA